MHWKNFKLITDKILWLHREALNYVPRAIFIWAILLFAVVSHADAETLVVPMVEEGIPEAGKRVRVYLPEYPDAYYVLFLPFNFTGMSKMPVVFESPGNVSQEVADGLPDSAYLGYGISFDMDHIWVCVPFIDNTGHILRAYWGKDPSSTVTFWLAVLNDLNAKFHIDNGRIILAGFSRGAVSTSYIGNYNGLCCKNL